MSIRVLHREGVFHPARGIVYLALLVCVVPTARLQATDPQLLPAGALWRFRVVGEQAPPPEGDWRKVEFDDSSWGSGHSGFSSAGDEATRLAGTNLTAALFRGRFVLDDPSTIRWLILRADFVSGFVAYLNGREIARRGVAGNPPPFDAVATAHARYATEELDVSAHREVLVAGTNLLAIQVHGSSLPASLLLLVPELCANFQRGPFLQNVSTQSVEIVWRTPVPATTIVEYGETPALGQVFTNAALITNHVATLSGLSPDTRWFYRVLSKADTNEAVSSIYSFRTFRMAGDISFAVFGDSGSGWMSQLRVASSLATAKVDVVLHTGDITYPSLNRGLVDTRCLSIYAPQMQGTPYFFTPGNHDLYAPDQLATYLETFRMPTNPATGTMHFYSFDHGDAHFISLFVPTLMNFIGAPTYGFRPGSAQLEWLANDLASTTRPWRIVFLHSPLFNSGGHRRDDYNFNGIQDRFELQELLLPVLSQHGVQLVFSGHDHNYEHLATPDGIHCFVTGGGGYVLYGLVERDAFSKYFAPTIHHLAAVLSGDSVDIQAVDQFGVVFDRARIPRVSAPRLRASVVGDATLRLQWNSAPGFHYQLEIAETPAGPFTALTNAALPLSATNYQAAFDLGLSPWTGQKDARFFRIRVLP